MLLAQKAIRKRLKEEVEAVAASDAASADVKAACQEYLDTFNCGVSNGDATDKLVAALDGCDCDTCKDIVKNKDFLAKNPSGSSVVTDGLTISDSAVLTTY